MGGRNMKKVGGSLLLSGVFESLGAFSACWMRVSGSEIVEVDVESAGCMDTYITKME